MLDELRARTIIALALALSASAAACSGDNVAVLDLGAGDRSVLWLFTRDGTIAKMSLADPTAPIAVPYQETERVYALIYPMTRDELQLAGDIPIPAADQPYRNLPTPNRAFVLEGNDRFLELQLPEGLLASAR